jgi:hypothetical protein
MTVAAPADTLTIQLEAACAHADCSEMAWRLHRKLDTPGYTQGVSILPLPATFDQWRSEHRTARKRADRSGRLGYRFATIDRSRFSDDIHEINTSLAERQGRPMAAGYLERQDHGPLPHYPCDRHRVHTYGVLQEGRLRAYLILYRVGELSLVSQILGHGDHLAADVMYLLASGGVEQQTPGGGFLYYNRHDSGTDGLRYYKERLGFRETDISWVL